MLMEISEERKAENIGERKKANKWSKASENVGGDESHGTTVGLNFRGRRKEGSPPDAGTFREFLSNGFHFL